MPHTEYEDLVDKACEANERSRDNETELDEVQEKLKALTARMDIQAAREALKGGIMPHAEYVKALAARMDIQDESMELTRHQVVLQDESMELIRHQVALLNKEVNNMRATFERIDRYLKEYYGQPDECDRNQVDDQRVLADVS